jgi:hypothetical protein
MAVEGRTAWPSRTLLMWSHHSEVVTSGTAEPVRGAAPFEEVAGVRRMGDESDNRGVCHVEGACPPIERPIREL